MPDGKFRDNMLIISFVRFRTQDSWHSNQPWVWNAKGIDIASNAEPVDTSVRWPQLQNKTKKKGIFDTFHKNAGNSQLTPKHLFCSLACAANFVNFTKTKYHWKGHFVKRILLNIKLGQNYALNRKVDILNRVIQMHSKVTKCSQILKICTKLDSKLAPRPV